MTEESTVFVLINIFQLAADKQQTLMLLLEDFTDRVTRHMPGFVSATVHRGIHEIVYHCGDTLLAGDRRYPN